MNFDLKLQILSNPSPTSSGHIDYGGWVTSPEWTTLERLNKPCLADHMGEDQLDGPKEVGRQPTGGPTPAGRMASCSNRPERMETSRQDCQGPPGSEAPGVSE